jgi:polar amino acid transport system permease protein
VLELDWPYIRKILPLYQEAAAMTLHIAVAGLALSLGTGLAGSLLLRYKIPVLGMFIKAYVQVARNVPVLVFLYFLFFGLVRHGVRLDAEVCAILGLAVMGGGYMTEAFRAGLDAVDKAQYESARSLGLSSWQTLRLVALPQAFAVVVPSLLANFHAILMETAICGFIAVPELMAVTRDQIGMYYKTYECFAVLTVCYLLLMLPFSFFAGYWERRLRRA